MNIQKNPNGTALTVTLEGRPDTMTPSSPIPARTITDTAVFLPREIFNFSKIALDSYAAS